jgi:beta-glucosidase
MTNALTQTWNRDLIAAQFKAVGDEYFAMGYNVVDGALLGPLGRVPEGRIVPFFFSLVILSLSVALT